DAGCRNARRLQGGDNRRMHLAEKCSRDRLEREFVGYAQAVDEVRFDAHSFEHARDLNTTAVDNDRTLGVKRHDLRDGRVRILQQCAADFHYGDVRHRINPASGSKPSIRLRFWIAWPAAPLTRLSMADTITVD